MLELQAQEEDTNVEGTENATEADAASAKVMRASMSCPIFHRHHTVLPQVGHDAARHCGTQHPQCLSPLQDGEGIGDCQSDHSTADAEITHQDAVPQLAAEVTINLFP